VHARGCILPRAERPLDLPGAHAHAETGAPARIARLPGARAGPVAATGAHALALVGAGPVTDACAVLRPPRGRAVARPRAAAPAGAAEVVVASARAHGVTGAGPGAGGEQARP